VFLHERAQEEAEKWPDFVLAPKKHHTGLAFYFDPVLGDTILANSKYIRFLQPATASIEHRNRSK
jgi:hypothetical protein